MPIPDWPSLSYGTTDKMVYEYQVQDMDKLWDEQVARVAIWLDNTEKYKVESKNKPKHQVVPQVRSVQIKGKGNKILLAGQQ